MPNKKNYPKNFSPNRPPHPPSKPSPTVDRVVPSDSETLTIDEGGYLPNDGKEYELNYIGEGYITIRTTTVFEQVPNPDYEKLMIKYNEDLAAHRTEKKAWKILKELWLQEEKEEKRQSELLQLEILKKKYESFEKKK